MLYNRTIQQKKKHNFLTLYERKRGWNYEERMSDRGWRGKTDKKVLNR